MTTAGFQCFNDNGSLQFSSEVFAYYLLSKGTVNANFGHDLAGASGGFDTCFTSSSPFTANDQTDIVALRCNTSPVFYEGGGAVVTANSANVDYWIYRPYTSYTTSNTHVGLQIFAANGVLTYSSDQSPLLYTTKVNITSVSNTINTYVPLPAGRQYAYMTSSLSVYEYANNSGVQPVYNITTGVYSPQPNGTAAGIQNNISNTGFFIKPCPGCRYTDGNKFDGYVTVVDVTNQ